jgi:N-acetylmuramoyl-L-alanine amidase
MIAWAVFTASIMGVHQVDKHHTSKRGDRDGLQLKSKVKKRRIKVNKKRFLTFIVIIGLIAFAFVMMISMLGGVTPAIGKGPSHANAPLKGKVIVVDAGHGGFDRGAKGVSGSFEDEINLNISRFLKEELEISGVKVIMTRNDENAVAGTKDEDMAMRRKIIEESESDIVISVHSNSHTDPSVSGPLVLYMPGSKKGERLARMIQEQLNIGLRPSRENSERAEDLYILRSGMQPSVLVECGYLSNAEEEAKLVRKDYQQKTARHILEGVLRFFAE